MNNIVTNKFQIFQSKEYRRSRNAYSWQCAFEYLVSLLVTDAFLAKLLSDVGLSDTVIGIISTIIEAAFVFQMASVFIVNKIKNYRTYAAMSNVACQIFLTSLYVIPFLPVSTTVKGFLCGAALTLGYFAQYSVQSIIYQWGNACVEPQKRASFGASKEMRSLVTGMVFTFLVGKMLDAFEAAGKLHTGFIVIGLLGLALVICDLVCLKNIYGMELSSSVTGNDMSMGKTIKYLINNKNYIKIIILSCTWDFARYFTIGYLGIYKTKNLLLTVGTVQIINIAGQLCRFALSKPIGHFSDKHSFINGIKLALSIALVGFIFCIFSAPGSVWCIVVFTLFYNISAAGTEQNFYNVLYSYIDEEYFISANAIRGCLSGVFGLIASLIASRVLDYVQSNGNSLFGIEVYGQQVMSCVTAILIAVCIIFASVAIPKKVMTEND